MLLGQPDRVERAIQLCRSCIEEYPDESRGFRITLGGLYEREERIEEALAEYEAARGEAKDDDYYRALYQTARLWIEQELESERAIELLDAAGLKVGTDFFLAFSLCTGYSPPADPAGSQPISGNSAGCVTRASSKTSTRRVSSCAGLP